MRERVDEKVRQDLVQAHRVPTADDRTIGANLELAPAETGRGGETFDDLARQRRQIHLLPLDEGKAVPVRDTSNRFSISRPSLRQLAEARSRRWRRSSSESLPALTASRRLSM